jgi:protein-S-isoprenylcysteine O-methyltransferase Ste14
MTHLYVGLAVALGLIVGFYWGRVIRLVRKTRRRTGKSAQFFPKEPLGRVLRVLWYPSVVWWVVQPWVVALLANRAPRAVLPLWPNDLAAGLGLAVALACLAATMVCWRRMGTSWRMGINPDDKTDLIVAGPYAYVAHPIYALQQLLVLASVVVIPSPVMIAAGCAMIALLQWEARREEKYLVSLHGDVYARYLAGVGRFIPRRLSPYSAT